MLQHLTLQNFRNYETLNIDFAPGINLIVGKNGQGKTNILEAVYYLSLLRSFRTSKLLELCKFESQQFTIFGKGSSGLYGNFTLGVTNGDVRKLVVNGIPCSLGSNFISKFICTAFIPEDLNIVKGNPAARRKFLDILICQLSMEYLLALQTYLNALKQRNFMLKQPDKYDRNAISAYNHILIKQAGIIEIARKQCIDKLNKVLLEKSRQFFTDGRIISLKYLSGCGPLLADIADNPEEIEKNYQKQLNDKFDRDIAEGTTKYGSHRSEFSCLLNNLNSAHFGSEGECRTIALALKLASMEILYENHDKNDITLIVDDVIGELDIQKKQIFFELLQKSGQVIIACTSVPGEIVKYNKMFRISNGKIIEEIENE